MAIAYVAVTVSWAEPPEATDTELGESDSSRLVLTLTVSGVLLEVPSSTTSCTT